MTDIQFYTLIGTLNIIIVVMGVGQDSKWLATFFAAVSAFWSGMAVVALFGGPL